MQPGRYVIAQVDPEEWHALRRLAHDFGVDLASDELYLRAGIALTLSEPRFLEFAERFGPLKGILTTYAMRVCDPGEIESAAWVRMDVRAQASTATGMAAGSVYDLTHACPECGHGARLDGPCKVQNPAGLRPEYPLARSFCNELVFQEPLRQALEGSGLRFSPLSVPGWWLGEAIECLPPVRPDTVSEPSCVCRRSGFSVNQRAATDLAYDGHRPTRDIVSTWEAFGPHSKGTLLSTPFLVMRQEIRRRLLAQGVTGCEFFPVLGLR